MSPKTFSIAAGLAVIGFVWTASNADASRSDEPEPLSNRPTVPVVDSSERVLLLYDGRILRGKLTETDDGYLLAQKLGQLRIRRREVEKDFESLQEVYAYKAERLPQDDPEEHLKFAQWCILEKLEKEARAELRKVLDLQPESRQARAMLFSIDAAAERMAKRRALADSSIARAGATVPVGTDGKPRALPAEIYQIRRGRAREINRAAPPAIFNLSPPLAVKRFQEFVTYVHPELQRQCASCHNERSKGKFVLLQARDRRMATDPLLLRTNLDAVLRLVNPENPSRSELLLSSVTDHPQINRPILSGPNHPTYRVFSTWVQRMKTPGADSEVVPTSAVLEESGERAGSSTGFAEDRLKSPRTLPTAAVQPTPKTVRDRPEPEIRHPSVPADADFRTVSPLIDPYNAAALSVGGKPIQGLPLGAAAPLPKLPGSAVAETESDGPSSGRQPTIRDPKFPAGVPLINPFKGNNSPAKRTPRKFKLDPAQLDKVMRAGRGS